MPELPDTSIKELTDDFGLTLKDAKTLVTLDNGERLEYFDNVLACLVRCLQDGTDNIDTTQCVADTSVPKAEKAKHARLVANWCVADR